MTTIIQANLNHTRQAHDLLVKRMSEVNGGLAVILEPHIVPTDNRCCTWCTSAERIPTVALSWQGVTGKQICCPIINGPGFALVEWNDIVVIGCYFLPNRRLSNFVSYLDDLTLIINRHRGRPLMVLGDFNARTIQWDRVTNTKGEVLADWAAGLGLKLLNKGHVPVG